MTIENWNRLQLQGAGLSHEGIGALSATASACRCSGKTVDQVPREDGVAKLSEALADGDIHLIIVVESDVVALAAGFLKILAGGGGFDFDPLAAACLRFCSTSFDALDARAAALLEMHRSGFGGSAGRGVRGAVKSTSMSSPRHKPTIHSPSAFG
jgi:hypothetical protein